MDSEDLDEEIDLDDGQGEEPEETGDDGEDGQAADAGLDEGEDSSGQDPQQAGQEAQGQPQGVNKRSVQARIKRLNDDRLAARKALQERDNELAELRAYRQQQEQAVRLRENQERARQRELLTPEERMSEELKDMRAELGYMRQQQQFQREDFEDQKAFQDVLTAIPALKKYEKAVNEHLQTLRRQGQNVSRVALLNYTKGMADISAAMTGKPGTAPKTRQTKPAPNARGSVSTTTRQPVSERERLTKLLDGVNLRTVR